MKYKFDNISNLNEMKEICFFIRAINEAGDKFNKKDLMPLKFFIENRYNLEIPLSKLYLFVEKIYYINGTKNKFPSLKEHDKIITEYLEYQKEKIKDAEIELLKQELNLKDAKYKTGKNEYKSAESLATNISVNKKIYSSNNNWLVVISLVTALFIISAATVLVGAFFPKVLSLYVSKTQELCLIAVMFILFSVVMYVLSINTYAKKTNSIRKTIISYNKYVVSITNDYLGYNNARLAYSTLTKDFTINGIEFSDKILYSYLTKSDKLDALFYGTQLKKPVATITKAPQGTTKIGIVLSRSEQNYNWLNSKSSATEKKKMNAEVVAEINTLAGKLKNQNSSISPVAQKITSLYCNELSLEKRKKDLLEAETKIELAENYVSVMDKINDIKQHEVFIGTDVNATRKYNLIEEAEMLSFKDFLGGMCDRIEKAGALKLLPQGQFETYKNIKAELENGIIYGTVINDINTRYNLNKLFIKVYNELLILDSLN